MMRYLRDAAIKKRERVLIRTDLDAASLSQGGYDDFRIRENVPSLAFLLRRGALVRILAHRGRPDGKKVPSYSLRPIASRLSALLKKPVRFVRDPSDDVLFRRWNSTPEILCFENLRFWQGEEENDGVFAKQLARWGDAYVNEAFAVSHRVHASLVGIPPLLPAFAGLRFEKEISSLSRLLHNPPRPVIAIFGGAKFETKLPALERFCAIADRILLAGALANAVARFRGARISGVPDEEKERVGTLPNLTRALAQGKICLPEDGVAARNLGHPPFRIADFSGLLGSETIVDIGPKTVEEFSAILSRAGTIIWNGPLGKVEIPRAREGTERIARSIAKIKAFSVVGGGDTVAALQKFRLLTSFSHVSTGGGAMLEFLAGKKLPGITALESASSLP